MIRGLYPSDKIIFDFAQPLFGNFTYYAKKNLLSNDCEA